MISLIFQKYKAYAYMAIAAVIALAAFWVVSQFIGLTDELNEAREAKIAAENRWVDSRTNEKTLEASLESANSTISRFQKELATRQQLLDQAEYYREQVDEVLSIQFKELKRLRQENAEYKKWADQSVPDAVSGLLDDTRNQIQNGGKASIQKGDAASPSG